MGKYDALFENDSTPVETVTPENAGENNYSSLFEDAPEEVNAGKPTGLFHPINTIAKNYAETGREIGNAFAGPEARDRATQYTKELSQYNQNPGSNAIDPILSTLGYAGKSLASVASIPYTAGARALATDFPGTAQNLKNVGSAVMNYPVAMGGYSPTVGSPPAEGGKASIADMITGLKDEYHKLQQEHPMVAQRVGNILDIAQGVGSVLGLKLGAKPVEEAISGLGAGAVKSVEGTGKMATKMGEDAIIPTLGPVNKKLAEQIGNGDANRGLDRIGSDIEKYHVESVKGTKNTLNNIDQRLNEKMDNAEALFGRGINSSPNATVDIDNTFLKLMNDISDTKVPGLLGDEDKANSWLDKIHQSLTKKGLTGDAVPVEKLYNIKKILRDEFEANFKKGLHIEADPWKSVASEEAYLRVMDKLNDFVPGLQEQNGAVRDLLNLKKVVGNKLFLERQNTLGGKTLTQFAVEAGMKKVAPALIKTGRALNLSESIPHPMGVIPKVKYGTSVVKPLSNVEMNSLEKTVPLGTIGDKTFTMRTGQYKAPFRNKEKKIESQMKQWGKYKKENR